MSEYLENGPSWPPGTPAGPLAPGVPPHAPDPYVPPPAAPPTSGAPYSPDPSGAFYAQQHPDGLGYNPYPQAHPQMQQPTYVYVGQQAPSYGLSTGMHVFHGVMTAATCLLWAPVWILHAMAARRRPIA